jgi:hypothetical protein
MGFLVASGIEPCLDLLPRIHVGEAELGVFATAMRRPVDDLRPLLGLRFTGDVWAMPDGASCWPLSRYWRSRRPWWKPNSWRPCC